MCVIHKPKQCPEYLKYFGQKLLSPDVMGEQTLGSFLVKSNMIRSHETGPEPQLFQGKSQANHKFKAYLDTIVRCYLKIKNGRGMEI